MSKKKHNASKAAEPVVETETEISSVTIVPEAEADEEVEEHS